MSYLHSISFVGTNRPPAPSGINHVKNICLSAAISAKPHPCRISYLQAPQRKGFWAARSHLPQVLPSIQRFHKTGLRQAKTRFYTSRAIRKLSRTGVLGS